MSVAVVERQLRILYPRAYLAAELSKVNSTGITVCRAFGLVVVCLLEADGTLKYNSLMPMLAALEEHFDRMFTTPICNSDAIKAELAKCPAVCRRIPLKHSGICADTYVACIGPSFDNHFMWGDKWLRRLEKVILGIEAEHERGRDAIFALLPQPIAEEISADY